MIEQFLLEKTGRDRRIAGAVGQAVITPWQRDLFANLRPGAGMLFRGDKSSIRQLAAELVVRGIGKRLPVSAMYSIGDLFESPEKRKEFEADPLALTDYETDSYLDYLRYMPPIDFSRCSTPVLILQGAKDRLVPADYARSVADRLSASSPIVKFELCDDGGHALLDERPAWSAQKTDEWIKTHVRRSAVA
jgi:pimeloyl-ACP methyl ester carboxylesterase